jgi:Carboxypeptidase regulatory-like domain/TonB dependent receptor
VLQSAPVPRLSFVLSCLAVAASAHAQISSGSISGLARDRDGAPLAGVVIDITTTAGTPVRSVGTSTDGRYLAAALTPGRYDLTARLPGFRSVHHQAVPVSTGETVSIDLLLEVGGIETSVVVTGHADDRSRHSAGLGQAVSAEQAQRLPLNGRSFISLAALAPGVALPPGSSLPRINGGRPRTNEYIFDGISVLQPEPGQVPFFPNIDAIQDFRIETNSPPAEFGRFNGGVVNLTTRAGGATVSGSAFEFLRHEALNARNPFAPADSSARFRRSQFGGVMGGPIMKNRTFFFADYQGQRQEIARTVISTVPTALQRGGVFTEPVAGRVPVIYDPATTTTAAAGAAIRTPFAGNVIPQDRMDPVALDLLGRYPLPTGSGTANNYTRVANETVDHDLLGLRVDHRLADRGDRVFARVTRFAETFLPVTPLPDGSGTTTGTLGPQESGAWALASAYQQVLSPTLLNEARVGHTRRTVQRRAVTLPTSPFVDLSLPGIPSTASFPSTLPAFQVAGYQMLGSPLNTASDFGTHVTQVADTLTWLRGLHAIKMGADLRWSALNIVQPPSPTGVFQFTNLFTDQPGVANTGAPFASFLLGQVQSFSIDLQQDEIRNRARTQEFFVQDDWRVSDTLTINAGLRHTLNFPSTEKQDQAAVLDFETLRLVYLGRDGQPRAARQLHTLNFGPRLGVVWRATPHTVVRGGYGLVWIEQAGITTPFTTPAFPFLQTASQRTLDNIAPAFTLASGPSVSPVAFTPEAGLGQGVFSVDRGLGSGYVQQWHAAVQRDLGRGWTADLAYVGSQITRVGIPDANLNQLSVDQLAIGSPLLERVPNPYFGIIPRSSSLGEPTITRAQLLKPFPEYTAVSLYRNNVGTTRYHGLEARLERRFSSGVSVLASYTRSRLVDDASSVFDASILTGPVLNAPVADAYDRARDRDVSTGDIPHVFVASVVAELPWGAGRRWHPGGVVGALANGWTITGIGTMQSGVPIAVTQVTNFNAFAGFGTQRPNLVGDPELSADERTTSRWFNTGAFAIAPQFTLGSASRNPVRGPAWRNLDLALLRSLPLTGRTALELRLEAFNVTNTPALGTPNGVAGSPAFGTITSAGDPRVVQLALRLLF